MHFPELSDAAIEAKAQSLIESYFNSVGKPIAAPIPVEVIAETYLGYELSFVDEGIFANPDVLGGIVFDENTIYINVATESHEGRYNFTIAHEIGHHALHRPLVDGANLICRESDTRPIEEAQADRFAAALLMPSVLVDKAVHDVKDRLKSSHVKVVRGYAAKVAKTANFTNVSNTAVVNRLIDLGYITSNEGYFSSFRSASYNKPHFIKSLIYKIFKRFYS
jgi:Zn-dependent peptidase ImmA (M78 family)